MVILLLRKDKMFDIRKAELDRDLADIHRIIRLSNYTVARDLGFTKENAPTSPAFIELDKVRESFDRGIEYSIGSIEEVKIACVAIEADKNDKENFFIERLAVLPEYRHQKYGEKLLDHALSEIKKKNGKSAGIAIIDENKKLKDWYLRYGFTETRVRKFDHLPFTVCFMSIGV